MDMNSSMLSLAGGGSPGCHRPAPASGLVPGGGGLTAFCPSSMLLSLGRGTRGAARWASMTLSSVLRLGSECSERPEGEVVGGGDGLSLGSRCRSPGSRWGSWWVSLQPAFCLHLLRLVHRLKDLQTRCTKADEIGYLCHGAASSSKLNSHPQGAGSDMEHAHAEDTTQSVKRWRQNKVGHILPFVENLKLLSVCRNRHRKIQKETGSIAVGSREKIFHHAKSCAQKFLKLIIKGTGLKNIHVINHDGSIFKNT